MYLALVATVAIVAHWRIRNFFWVTTGCALVGAIGFQVVGYLQLGYLHKLALVGFFFGFMYAWVVGAVVGIVFMGLRR
jgi:hypothetical protein